MTAKEAEKRAPNLRSLYLNDSGWTERRGPVPFQIGLATFALGTAVGDLTADSWGLGNLVSGLLCVALILLPLAAHRWLRLGAIPAFWIAYVITRPLGASFADWMSYRGLGLGSALCAVIWAAAFAALVAFLAVTRNDALSAPKGPHAAFVPTVSGPSSVR